jgi:hypothetical protein
VLKAALEAQHLGDNIEAVRIEAIAVNKLCDSDIAFGRERRQEVETILWRRNLVRAASPIVVRSLPSTKTRPREACANPPIT